MSAAVLDRANIEAILPLTPVQEALLFATLGAPGQGADPGFLQLRCTLRGILDESPFRRAWNYVVERHGALRASVHWRESDRPLQVVARRVEPPVRFEDWRAGESLDRDRRIAAFLDEDRASGLDPARPPVHRLTLVRVRDDEWQLIWSCHHLHLDGWSGALLLNELSVAYEALCEGREPGLPAAPPYRDYITWLQRTDERTVEDFWRTELAGMTTATPLPFDRSHASTGSAASRHEAVTTELDPDETGALRAFARQHRLTVGAVVQGVWALLLGARAGDEPVCFGATVSGRSSPVAGIEAMAGLFNNALPVRLGIPRDRPVVEFLGVLQERLAAIQRHVHASPARLQTWSDVPGTQRLFESLVVFENFPADVLGSHTGRLTWHDLRGGITSTHPLVLVASPGDRLALTLLHDPDRITGEDALRIASALHLLFSRVIADPRAPAGSLVPAEIGGSAIPAAAASPNGAAPPSNALELRLCRIWERVLGTAAFGVEDDFFRLGGHSLLVARMIAEIETQLDVRLPVATFFREPTVRALAGAIERHVEPGDRKARSALLFPLAAGGKGTRRPPLFFLHSLRGDVVVSYKLLRYLDEDQPVYGVQAVGSDGRSPPESRLEDMAAAYVREICTLQPEGPYFLGGYCFGGTLAYETARQLTAQGREVALLAVIDSDPRQPPWRHTSRLARALQELWVMPAGARAARIRRLFVRGVARFAGTGARSPAEAHDAGQVEPPEPAVPFALDQTNSAAFLQYSPQPFSGRVTVILARDDPPGLSRWRRRQWAALSGEGTVVHDVPGTHYTLMTEPHVRGLAERVQQCVVGAVAGAIRETARDGDGDGLGAGDRVQGGRGEIDPIS